MSRRLRYVPVGGALVEVTSRTIQGQFLLRPSPEVNRILLGIVGRAQRRYEVAIVYMAWLSNHFHFLIKARDARQVSDFMRDVKSGVAREINRLLDRTGIFWSDRYSETLISDEPAAQIERLRYCLAQGVKEGLVDTVEEWPGIQCATPWIQGKALGSVLLAKLPCCQDLSDRHYREFIQDLVDEIDRCSAEERQRTGIASAGVHHVLSRSPEDRPIHGIDRKEAAIGCRSPAPLVHAYSRRVRRAWIDAYRLFEQAFREASLRWLAGDTGVCFPRGSFPPRPPFVGGLPAEAG